MYFFFFTAPRNSNSAFLSCIPISPSHSFPLCFCPFLVLSPFAHDGVLIGSFSYLHTLCFHSAASPPDVITVGLTFKGIMWRHGLWLDNGNQCCGCQTHNQTFLSDWSVGRRSLQPGFECAPESLIWVYKAGDTNKHLHSRTQSFAGAYTWG